MLRIVLIVVASAYTLIGIAGLLLAFVFPSDDPLSATVAIIPALPWSFLLGALGLYSESSVAVNIAVIAGAIALNAGLLWWWALTREGGKQ